MVSVNLINDLVSTQEQLGETSGDGVLLFKLFNSRLSVNDLRFEAYRRGIGHCYVAGHPVNSVVGVANGVDGQQLVVGEQAKLDQELAVRFFKNNLFMEKVRSDSLIDFSQTTSTVDTANGTFGEGTVVSSCITYLPGASLNKFEVTLNYSGVVSLYLSVSDDPTTPGVWELVSIDGSGLPTSVTLTNSGSALFYKLEIAAGGSVFNVYDDEGVLESPALVIKVF